MTCQIINGPSFGNGSRDKDGYVTYKVWFLVGCDPTDGPANVLLTPGLPIPGSFWQFYDDSDSYAFCYWACELEPKVTDEPNSVWKCTFTFSTKPETKFCRDTQVTDPILEPPKISGSFAHYVEEASYDRFGMAITNSAWEQIRGPHNEWDRNRLSVNIEQNVLSPLLGYVLPQQMLDCVNGLPLWGLPPRTIKLSGAPWTKEFYGPCYAYYKRTLKFDIRHSFNDQSAEENWDRDVLDEGTKVLKGHWNTNTGTWVLDNIDGQPPDPYNPKHFIKSVGLDGNPCKILLNGLGQPAGTVVPQGAQYLSMVDHNIGFPLDNGTKWIPLSASVPTPNVVGNYPIYDLVTNYRRGDLVVVQGSSQVSCALFANVGGPFPTGVPGNDGTWFNLVANTLPVNAGTYNPAADYATGDYVFSSETSGDAGLIHIERYSEVDFTLLGLPLSF